MNTPEAMPLFLNQRFFLLSHVFLLELDMPTPEAVPFLLIKGPFLLFHVFLLELDMQTPEAMPFFLHCRCLAEKGGVLLTS
jgi:hypothetical protein